MSPSSGQRARKAKVVLERIVLAASVVAVTGLLITLAVSGSEYYSLPTLEQLYSRERELYGTTGEFGMWAGIIAALLFLSNFGYLLRKHFAILEHLGTLRAWLDWHVASAILGAGFVALHANFSMRNWIAKTCVYAVVIMIATGVIGRYLLRFVPRSESGERLDAEGFEDEVLELIEQVRHEVLHDPNAVIAMQALVDELEADEVLPGLGELRRRLRESRRHIQAIEKGIATSKATQRRAEARELHRRLVRLGMQAAVAHWAGRLMDSWRALHRTFALLLLVGMTVHIFISLYYGYGAVWR